MSWSIRLLVVLVIGNSVWGYADDGWRGVAEAWAVMLGVGVGLFLLIQLMDWLDRAQQRRRDGAK